MLFSTPSRAVLAIAPLVLSASVCAAQDLSIVVSEQFFAPMADRQPAMPGQRQPVFMSHDGRDTLAYVASEFIVQPRDEGQLQAFLAKYNGRILRDLRTPADSGSNPAQAGSGFVLVGIDPATVDDTGLDAILKDKGISGRSLFSSPEALATAAVLALEPGMRIWPNILLTADAVNEHPDGSGGFQDAETWPWMTEDDDPSTPQIDGLSVGVINAWRYLSYIGIPPANGTFDPPVIAIIDGGFAMNPDGTPLNGNLDFFPTVPQQFDLVDFDGSADGPNLNTCTGGAACPWHGTGAFGVALARNSNQYGGAGTSGNIAWPMLIRKEPSLFGTAEAIRVAALNGADVISISSGGGCQFASWLCTIPPDDFYAVLQSEIDFAVTGKAVVLASAGNGIDVDVATVEQVPCKLDRVICVGSVDGNGMNVFQFGDKVDIWAPTNVFATVDPDTAPDVKVFGGTSASAPFVAGIVGLMKAANPDLSWQQVQDILQQTANPSSDPLLGGKGYVDAFRAVRAVRDHLPPTIAIQRPVANAVISYRSPRLQALASDPESDDPSAGRVVWSSNIDGELCVVQGLFFAALPTQCQTQLSPGSHVITATAIDRFEGVASQTVGVTAVNTPPTVKAAQFSPGASFFANQQVSLFAQVNDVDEGPPFAQDRIRWTSSIDGVLGTGTGLAVTLSPGDHLLTVVAEDELGLLASDTTAVTIKSAQGVPSVTILSPTQGIFAPGAVVTFSASAIDPEDGELTGSSLEWASDRDGPLGSGNLVQTDLSGPQTACNPETVRHAVTLTATDSDGNVVTEEVRVAVGIIC